MNELTVCLGTGRDEPSHQRATCRDCRRHYSREHMRRKRRGELSRDYGTASIPTCTDVSKALFAAINGLSRNPRIIESVIVRRALRELAGVAQRAQQKARGSGQEE